MRVCDLKLWATAERKKEKERSKERKRRWKINEINSVGQTSLACVACKHLNILSQTPSSCRIAEGQAGLKTVIRVKYFNQGHKVKLECIKKKKRGKKKTNTQLTLAPSNFR